MTKTISEILREKIGEYEATGEPLLQLARDCDITYGVLWRFVSRPKYSPTLRIIQKLVTHFRLELVPMRAAQ